MLECSRRWFAVVGLVAAAVGGRAEAQLAVTTRAAINGQYGVEVEGDGTGAPVWFRTRRLAGHTDVQIRLLLQARHATVADGKSVTIVAGRDHGEQTLFGIELVGYADGNYVRGQYRDGAGELRRTLDWKLPEATEAVTIELLWRRGVDDGLFQFGRRDREGVLHVIDSGYDLANNFVLLHVYFGAPDGTEGLSGYYAMDDVDGASLNWYPSEPMLLLDAPMDRASTPLTIHGCRPCWQLCAWPCPEVQP